MMGRVCWFAFSVAVCFTVISANDFQGHNALTGEGRVHPPTCHDLCKQLNIENGCKSAPSSSMQVREEVIVVTNSSSDIETWEWDTITMVVSAYFDGISNTGRTACITHSKGKRFGLREPVPGSDDINKILGDLTSVKKDFEDKIKRYQTLLMADHIVFDLLDFCQQLLTKSDLNQSLAISKMNEILSSAADKVLAYQDSSMKKVFCIVPWEPPCKETDCEDIRLLLGNCQVLVLSPDSYIPIAPDSGECRATATVPISQFLYGVDRYIALRAQYNVQTSIVAGIPWHGYSYKCSNAISDDRCTIHKNKGERCFDSTNRQRMSLSDIHGLSLYKDSVKMDVVSKGIYYNKEGSHEQLWFENFTTLLIKYQLVKDLGLRGLSIWYGEDLEKGISTDTYAFDSWDFLTHQVLHKVVYSPAHTTHYYADTVAGVGVGCLVLGTVLGVIFTCIGMRRRRLNRQNRPFKLDEVDDDFRDDEGL